MAWRTVMIQNPAKLSLQRGQLQLKNKETEISLPIEDIAALILESAQISLSSALLAACQEKGVVIITCGETHMPNGLLLPFQPHSRQSRVAHIQQSCAAPLKKRLWQRTVRAKVLNQAACLRQAIGPEESKRLQAFAARIASGDPDNIEAQAARDYWPRLFGDDFRRHRNDNINGALNYGYAIIRAFVARAQAAYGLIPAFGIHHDNELNAFNLTDDMMEVFRPIMDYQIFEIRQNGDLPKQEDKLSWETRQILARAGNIHCQINEQIHSLSNACELMAAGLVTAIEEKNPDLLPLPEFLSVPSRKNGA